MKWPNKPIFFVFSAIAGIVVAAVLISITLYQYANLSILIESSPEYGVVLSSGSVASIENSYLIIILATAPLMLLSIFLLLRSLKRLRKERGKAKR